MPDYSQGKIYKITSPNCKEVYIGSTTQSLNKRLIGHKSSCRTKNCTSKKVIESGEAVIELIEEFICETRTELERREGEIQKSTLDCCNNNIAGQTQAEYYKANTDTILQQTAEYRKLNADTIKEYESEYRKLNVDTIKEYQSEYYVLNADKIKKRKAEYYQKKKSALVI